MREQRVGEAIREEISDILHNELRDPRVGFLSVTTVEMSADLKVAKVGVSILGDQKQQEQAMKVLRHASGFVRSELAKRISLRQAPDIVFKLDASIEHSLRISKLLNELAEAGPKGAAPASQTGQGKREKTE
ncbi:MAG: 30S ribosome-binding factor RbfA [Bacillota bacterium]|nr:30S ribosome-binding factor RbfA [Bacillota bacterium]